MSEANRQTQSKDPVPADSATSHPRNFRIVVRFFDERESELRPVSSGEATEWESPAPRCRVTEGRGTSHAETARSHERMTQ